MKKPLLTLPALLVLAGALLLVHDVRSGRRSGPVAGARVLAWLRADFDDDGAVDAADDGLKRSGQALIVRMNDDLANGLHDDAAHGDDDLQEFDLAFADGVGDHVGAVGAEARGLLWVETSGLDVERVRFFTSRSAAPESEVRWPLELSGTAAVPPKLFMRVDGPLRRETAFELRLVLGTSRGEARSVDATRISVVAGIGDPDYFAAARRYMVQNRTPLFADRAVFHRGEAGREEGFYWVLMRSEAVRLRVIDGFNGRERKIYDIAGAVAAYPEAIAIVNGGSVWDADGKTTPPVGDVRSLRDDPDRHITKMTNGGIVTGGVPGVGQPYRHRDGRIVEGAGYIGWTPERGFEFGVGAMVPADRGFAEALGGLLPNASYDKTRCGLVGQVDLGGGRKLVLVAGTDLGHRIDGQEDAGAGQGATAFRTAAGESAGPGKLTLYFRDSASSVALAHRDADGVLKVQCAGWKHTWHQPYMIHNYLAFEAAGP